MQGYSVKNKDIPDLFQMWGDVFNFQKKFYNVPTVEAPKEEQDLFWQEVTKDADEIIDKFNSKLSEDIVHSIINDLNERAKIHGKE